MSQIIKKQIRKTMPLFMIFSLLISTSVAGLVFNLDFKIVNTINKHLGLELSLSEAQAADTASTTVTVRNAPPNLVGNVAESPASAANTPVNVGYPAFWQATANDPELNQYYLLVCETDGATASTTGVPSCNGGINETFCVSGLTNSGSLSTCIDSSLDDPGAESDVWYAYVCDNHSGEAECSSANQGLGDSGSPIYINHAPIFTTIVTSDDYKNPGGTFTVTASTTEDDVQGADDEVYLAVCSTNAWATSTGCVAATWCTGTTTLDSVNYVSCSFATTTPAVDGTYATGYYAFIKDWHQMPAPVNGRSASYTVNNVAPSVSNVIINGGSPIELEQKDQPDARASSSADLYDANSCLDVNAANSATSSIFISNVSGGLNCSANNNNCYQLVTSECSYVAGSCTGPSDTTSSYMCSTTITHYASPSDTTTGNPNVLENWLAGVTAIDNNGLKGSAISVSGVELWGTIALGIDELQIPYGAIRGGQNSGAYNATTTVVNFGNIPIDTEVKGYNMIKSDLSDAIVESMQHYNLSNFSYPGGTALSSTTPATVDTLTAKPTSLTDVSDQIFWGIGIPGGTSSGDYGGSNVFTALVDDNDW